MAQTQNSDSSIANEVFFTPQGCDLLYAGRYCAYRCNCSDQPHEFKSHAIWATHCGNNPDLTINYKCLFCNTSFVSIKSVAQHSRHCRLAIQTQDTVSIGIKQCPWCACRAQNKRGLSRHIHRKHPNELFEKYSNKRLVDRRWDRCETKILAKGLYKRLVDRKLPLNGDSINQVARSAYLDVKQLISKSFKHVLQIISSNGLQRRLEKIIRRKARSGHKLTTQGIDVFFPSGSIKRWSCNCKALLSDYIRNQLISWNPKGKDRRMAQQIRRALNAEKKHEVASKLLSFIYNNFGEKIDGDVRKGKHHHLLSKLDQNELMEKLGSKGFMNHLSNPNLINLEPNEEAINWFTEQFERPSIIDNEKIYDLKDPSNNTCYIHSVVSVEQVQCHRKSFENDTASGADKFSAVNLKAMPDIILAILMNLFIFEGDVPNDLKINRTTLLAKKDNPGPQDWRPITVSSVIYRLFSKILTERLGCCTTLSPHQRAFTQGIDGCGENISVLAMLIKNANAGKGPLFACSTDLAKAFDSVSFSSIIRALNRQKVDVVSISLLSNIIHNNVTLICNEKTAKINRGVRQGDPISPLLFNLVIDELLCKLKDYKYGASYPMRNKEIGRIAAIAFADDITILSDSQRCLERQLTTAIKFFDKRGMRINIKKSSCLAIKRLPKSDVYTPLPVTINLKNIDSNSMEQLPWISPNSEYRVLGAYISPTGKAEFKMGRLGEQLGLIESSKLSPFRKFNVIKNHIINSFRFQVVYGGVKPTVAKLADKLIRKSVKRIYGLPNSTAKQFFYIPVSKGGLGLENLEFASTCLRIKLELNLLRCEREATRESISVAKVLAGYQECNRNLGRQEKPNYEPVDWAVSNNLLLLRQLGNIDVEDWYLNCRKRKAQIDIKKILTKIQGAAFHHLKYAPTGYLLEPKKYNLEEHKFPLIYAIRLGTIQVLSNSKLDIVDRKCRLCRVATETPLHVMSLCGNTKRWRIERHNAITNLLYRELKTHLTGERGYVLIEPGLTITHNQNEVRFKPDIIAVYRKVSRLSRESYNIVIIDVTCCWEDLNGRLMGRVYKSKCNKYRLLERALRNKQALDILKRTDEREGSCSLMMVNPESDINIWNCPIVIGIQGGWLPLNDLYVKHLGIKENKDLVNQIMRTAAERSINVYKKFMGEVRSREVDNNCTNPRQP